MSGWLDEATSADPGHERRRLRIGWVPRAHEYAAIAYMRAGSNGVAETTVSGLVAAGYLVPHATDKKLVQFTGASDPAIRLPPLSCETRSSSSSSCGSSSCGGGGGCGGCGG